MSSPIYWHPWIYESSIRFLYGNRYRERLDAMAAWIPNGATVVDCCAGDCAVYRYALQERNVRYMACDMNPVFTGWAKKRGIETTVCDILHDPIPRGDCVIMMISLYQFIPQHETVIQNMMEAAGNRVIISEPVRNWAQSGNPIMRGIGRFVTRTGSANNQERFTKDTFIPCLQSLGFTTFQPVAGEREILAVYEKHQ